jgi:hypothetical protein
MASMARALLIPSQLRLFRLTALLDATGSKLPQDQGPKEDQVAADARQDRQLRREAAGHKGEP